MAKAMRDKVLHTLAGAVIALTVLAIFALFQTQWHGWEKFIALSVSILISAAKEVVWDKWLKRGTPDFYDFVAGLYGAFGGVFLWVIMETII